MSKSTPGPWRFQRPLNGKGFSIFDSTHALIAEIRSELEINADLNEIEANARLIAAAPQLLVALKGVLAIADRKTKEFDAARAIIAKAEGLDK